MPSNTLSPIQLDSQYTTESLVRGLDFTPQLAKTGDNFIGTPSVTATVIVGQDPTPIDILSGSPTLSANGMQILQRIAGGVAGCAYLLAFKCSTVQGNTLEGQAVFYVVQG